jgi:hypothetical protein
VLGDAERFALVDHADVCTSPPLLTTSSLPSTAVLEFEGATIARGRVLDFEHPKAASNATSPKPETTACLSVMRASMQGRGNRARSLGKLRRIRLPKYRPLDQPRLLLQSVGAIAQEVQGYRVCARFQSHGRAGFRADFQANDGGRELAFPTGLETNKPDHPNCPRGQFDYSNAVTTTLS